MSDDHYVAQTYLKHFTDVRKPGFLHVYRKKDLKVHPAAPRAICFEEDGDLSPYFDDPLILRTYLQAIEPRWNSCISTIENGVANEETKWIVSGYIAFLRACSPTMRRLGTTTLEALVEATRPSVARYVQANTPQQDHAEQVVATLLNPSVYVSVDAQYPKALGITSLIAIQKRYWESPWLILRNDAEIPFLTSDYPANPYYHNNDPQRFHVYVPLTPQHALLITPLPDTERMHAHAQDSYGIVKRQQVKLFNRTVVQCAENVVLSDRQSPWIRELVEKYRYWRVESLSDKIPVSESGYYFITRMRAIERKPDEETLPRLSSH